MNQVVTKKEDRASLNVSKDTRDEFMSYLAALIGQRGEMITQDEAVKEMLIHARTALAKERDLTRGLDLTPSYRIAEKEAEKEKRVDALLKKGLKE
jgi:predicted component of type VI protein secretion system